MSTQAWLSCAGYRLHRPAYPEQSAHIHLSGTVKDLLKKNQLLVFVETNLHCPASSSLPKQGKWGQVHRAGGQLSLEKMLDMKSCFSQVRGYLDFDVEMENVGVFWSGTEALLLEYRWEDLRCLILHYCDTISIQPRAATAEREAEDVEEWLGAIQAAAEGDWEQPDGETSSRGRRVGCSPFRQSPWQSATFLAIFLTICYLLTILISIFLTICNLPNLTSHYQGGSGHPWRVPAPASHWAWGGTLSAKSIFHHPSEKFLEKCCC